MFCEKCGAKLADNAKFCPSCGAKIDAHTKTETKVTTVNKPVEKKTKKPFNNEMFAKPLRIFKGILGPFGIIIAAFAFLSNFFIWLATMNAMESSSEGLLNASKYIGIVTWVFVLLIMLLLLTHTVFQSIRLRKHNLKEELPGAIINGIVVLLIFIFLINAGSCLFAGDEYGMGINFYNLPAYWGILTILFLFVGIWAIQFKKVESNRNVNILKAISKTILLSMIFVLISMVLSFGGFFRDTTSEFFEKLFSGSYFAQKYVVGAMGIIMTLVIFGIPSIVMGVKDKRTNRIVLWSIFAGLTLTFFMIIAIMLKVNETSFFFEENSTVCTVFVIFASLWTIPCGIVTSKSAKNCLEPIK